MAGIPRIVSGSSEYTNTTGQILGSESNVSSTRNYLENSANVRPDVVDDFSVINPEVGEIYFDGVNKSVKFWNGVEYKNVQTDSIIVGQRAANYSALVPGNYIGELAYVNASQGTKWLPGGMGGSYYPQGWYIWDGVIWISDRNSIANQLQLNIDEINGKADIVHTHVKADITDFNDGDYATANDGLLANSALQPLDNISELTNDLGFITSSASAIIVADEGVELTTGVTKFNFVGSNVTVTEPTPDEVLVSITGGGGGGPTNTVTDYRSSFEADGYVYAGYLLNSVITITKTFDGVINTATGLTDLETDWTNRLTLTYV